MGMGWRSKPISFSVAQASAGALFLGYLVLVYRELAGRVSLVSTALMVAQDAALISPQSVPKE